MRTLCWRRDCRVLDLRTQTPRLSVTQDSPSTGQWFALHDGRSKGVCQQPHAMRARTGPLSLSPTPTTSDPAAPSIVRFFHMKLSVLGAVAGAATVLKAARTQTQGGDLSKACC